MKKRLHSMICVLAALVLVLATAAAAEETPLAWNVAEDGTLTVSGTTIPDYSEENPAPWNGEEIAPTVTKIVVEDGTETVGENAFAALTNAAEVALPGSVTTVGAGALPL